MLNCDQNGPPRNLAHRVEWSFSEFSLYMNDHFHVISHYIANEAQATQVVVAEPKP